MTDFFGECKSSIGLANLSGNKVLKLFIVVICHGSRLFVAHTLLIS